jgi:hypothetical protein
MSPLVADLPVEAILGISLPLIIGGTVAVTALITGHFRKTQRDDMEATLKMEMIQRGMSAEEIERVLAARMDNGFGFSRGRHARWGAACEHQRRAAESMPR